MSAQKKETKMEKFTAVKIGEKILFGMIAKYETIYGIHVAMIASDFGVPEKKVIIGKMQGDWSLFIADSSLEFRLPELNKNAKF